MSEDWTVGSPTWDEAVVHARAAATAAAERQMTMLGFTQDQAIWRHVTGNGLGTVLGYLGMPESDMEGFRMSPEYAGLSRGAIIANELRFIRGDLENAVDLNFMTPRTAQLLEQTYERPDPAELTEAIAGSGYANGRAVINQGIMTSIQRTAARAALESLAQQGIDIGQTGGRSPA